MKRTLMSAVLIAVTSPAMACPDWKAVATFDAALLAHDEHEVNGIGATPNYGELVLAHAIAAEYAFAYSQNRLSLNHFSFQVSSVSPATF
jgi:hypothetical protein